MSPTYNIIPSLTYGGLPVAQVVPDPAPPLPPPAPPPPGPPPSGGPYAFVWDAKTTIQAFFAGKADITYNGSIVASVCAYYDGGINPFQKAQGAAAIALSLFHDLYYYGCFDKFQDFCGWPQNQGGFVTAENPDGKAFNVIVSSGLTHLNLPFAAAHRSCANGDILICPDDYAGNVTQGTDPYANSQLISFMIQEELSEVFMTRVPNLGDCDTRWFGEALSVVIAHEDSQFVMAGDVAYYLNDVSGPGATRGDFIATSGYSYPTGQGEAASQIACNVLFLFWLRSKLGYDWRSIMKAIAGTIGPLSATSCAAQVWANLTDNLNGAAAFANFSADLAAAYPSGPVYDGTNNKLNPWSA